MAQTNWLLPAGILATVTLAVVALSSRRRTSPSPSPAPSPTPYEPPAPGPQPNGGEDPDEPLDRPSVPADLGELDQMLIDEGVKNFTAGEFLWLPNWSRYADLPDEYVPNLLAIARVAQLLRDRVGHPVQIASGYRPRAYNEQAGGAKNSAHLRAAGVDLVVPESARTPERVWRFRVEAAKLWLEIPDVIAGMGVYGGSRGRTHLDVHHPGGAGHRQWGDGPRAEVISEAKAELGLA